MITTKTVTVAKAIEESEAALNALSALDCTGLVTYVTSILDDEPMTLSRLMESIPADKATASKLVRNLFKIGAIQQYNPTSYAALDNPCLLYTSDAADE